MASSSLVIKVEYGDTLKRFRVAIQNEKLALDMFMLREKIRRLFSFGPGVDFTLTYVDEDDEVVTLAADGDDDLDDVLQQSMNPLYITVKLTNSISGGSGWPQSCYQYSKSGVPYQDLGYFDPLQPPWAPQFGRSYSHFPYQYMRDLVPPQSPRPHFYPFSNFRAAQTVNSSTLYPQSQIVKPAFSHTLKKPLQQHPYQTRFSELVGKMMADASKQPMTCGSSNGDGQQGATSKISTYKESKVQLNPEVGSKSSKKYQSKLDSELLHDVTVRDGTIMAPFTKFTKIWRMRNKGTIAWPQGSKLQWIAGHVLSNNSYSVSVDVEIPTDGLPVDGEIDIAVDFIAPGVPGRYFSYWRMMSPYGEQFGQSVWVSFQVVNASMKAVGETLTNVNLPPVVKNPEVVYQEMESENKLVSDSDSVFDRKEVGTALASAPSEVSSNDQEQALLKDLEDMGFKQLDLNKEILRMNNYDLEKSVDDLCGVSEWDPMLDELQELGFTDDEAMKKLLKKNNGSIKRVVMDLINEEKD